MTAAEGKAIAILLNFIFLGKGYTMDGLERAAAALAKTGKLPGWDEDRVHWEATPRWRR